MSSLVDRPSSEGQQVRVPSVTVIIPTYNDLEGLTRCLSLLARQDYPPDSVDVVVVDNNSTVDLRPALPDDARFRLIHEKRRGSYAARNTGTKHARGEVLAFTDADCLPRSDWLRRGVAALYGNGEPDAVGGAINLILERGRRRSTGPELYDALEGFPQEHFITHYPFAATANVFVRVETFRTVGAFDAELKSGGDREWGMRLDAGGRSWLFAADAVVDHPSRATWAELTRKSIRVATGVADLAVAEPWRNVLVGIMREARGGVSIWRQVWTIGTDDLPTRTTRVRYAGVYAYVRALRSGVRLLALARRQLSRRRAGAAIGPDEDSGETR